jgi:hypothetical protein
VGSAIAKENAAETMIKTRFISDTACADALGVSRQRLNQAAAQSLRTGALTKYCKDGA